MLVVVVVSIIIVSNDSKNHDNESIGRKSSPNSSICFLQVSEACSYIQNPPR